MSDKVNMTKHGERIEIELTGDIPNLIVNGCAVGPIMELWNGNVYVLGLTGIQSLRNTSYERVYKAWKAVEWANLLNQQELTTGG